MKDDYGKNVEMICPVCGSRTFEYDKEIEDSPVKCDSCKKEFTRDGLFEANRENLTANMDDLKKEVLKDTESEIKKMFKKSFGNNKNFKIK